jgi:hypothetical protein
MKFTEAQLESAIVELLETEGYPGLTKILKPRRFRQEMY